MAMNSVDEEPGDVVQRRVRHAAAKMPMGRPTIHDTITAAMPICIVSGPRRSYRRADRLVRPERAAHVAPCDVPYPRQVLDHQRLVQPQALASRLQLRLAQHVDPRVLSEDLFQRVARKQPHRHEDQHRDSEHGRHRKRQPSEDISLHVGVLPDPSGEFRICSRLSSTQ